jgi:hypothetical protein
VAEATAEGLLKAPRGVVKIDCAEYQHSHEIAKLIGSPPGYLGHRETHPPLSQEVLNPRADGRSHWPHSYGSLSANSSADDFGICRRKSAWAV